MKISKKKAVVVLIVFLEIGLGFLFLKNNYYDLFLHKKVLGTISRDNVILSEDQNHSSSDSEIFNFKHYFEYKPSSKIIVERDWLLKSVTYHINDNGFNDELNYQTSKSNDVIRIAAIGDSFTFGNYVNTDQNWPSQLELMLNRQSEICKFEVINMGLGAADIPYLIRRYHDLGKTFKSDIVLWYESGSGFSRDSEMTYEITKDCKNPRFDSNSDDLDINKIHYCWDEAQKKINDIYYDVDDFIIHVSKYFDYFFKYSIGQSQLIYFTPNKDLNERSLYIFEYLDQRYNRGYFIKSVEQLPLSEEYRLLDHHPTVMGHKFIAEQAIQILSDHDITQQCFR